MSAGWPSRAVSLLPPVWRRACRSAAGTCRRCVNFRTCVSLAPLPAIQTLSLVVDEDAVLVAAAMRSPAPGPPQARSRLPSASNSMTDGAGQQHSRAAGLRGAALRPGQRARALHDPDVVVARRRRRRRPGRRATGWAAASASGSTLKSGAVWAEAVWTVGGVARAGQAPPARRNARIFRLLQSRLLPAVVQEESLAGAASRHQPLAQQPIRLRFSPSGCSSEPTLHKPHSPARGAQNRRGLRLDLQESVWSNRSASRSDVVSNFSIARPVPAL